MKRIVSTLLAVMFILTGLGFSTIFGGIIAGAEFYDYYVYTPITGLNSFTDAELAMFQNDHSAPVVNSVVGDKKAVDFELIAANEWNSFNVSLLYMRNRNPGNHTNGTQYLNGLDAALDYVNGKSVMGDLTFNGQNGVSFWIGKNGENYTGRVQLWLKQVACIGPYFNEKVDTEVGSTVEELSAAGIGFSYKSVAKYPDADGYVHFDFKTDFKQVDWWTVDDDGINRSIYSDVDGDGVPEGDDYVWPIPKSKIEKINGFGFDILEAAIGDVISIGDMNMYRDIRIHTDELEELIYRFDMLNPDEYTATSVEAAADAYFYAYEIYCDPDIEHKYTQENIDEAAVKLKKALEALQPLFKKESTDVIINGFEVLTEEDIEAINNGGSSLDIAYVTDEVAPDGAETSICVVGGAFMGDPSYGWSNFQTTVEGEDGPVAVKNVFGAENLDLAAGIRFWFAPADTYEPKPSSIIVGIGSSSLGAYFETNEMSIDIVSDGGYIAIPWANFYAVDGDYDVFDIFNELDYISIKIYECEAKEYYISDLHTFEWSMASADFNELEKTIAETYLYLDTLKEEEWYYLSWDRVLNSLEYASELIKKYAVTQQEADEAIADIQDNVNKLIKNDDLADRKTMTLLQTLYAAGKNYWRGNITPASYRNIAEPLAIAEELIADGPSQEDADAAIAALDAAINSLVPITAGEKVTSIYSFESYSTRDLNKANGDRTEGAQYSLASAEDVPGIPEGYAKALKITATRDMFASNTDEHGVLQFKAMTRDLGGVTPIKLGSNGENTLIGDLSGTDGICLWIGVNDVNLVQECTFRFAVSNCTTSPLFERAAHDIPLPSTGSGWIYIPWEYFEFYDEWTNGEPINLAQIYFYILRFNGTVKAGLEVYATGIHAYKNTSEGEWSTPVIENITEGQTVDVSETAFIPKWDTGTATLDGVNFIYGNAVVTNGEHVLEVRNGNKFTKVNFTVTGGEVNEMPVVSGVEDGGVYEDAVTISWSVGTAILNSKTIENGAVITAPGRYTLVVFNGTKDVTIKFEISDKPDVMKGDPDGDGMITVADALYTLRIAAQLTEGTADDLLVVDTDGDGSVTVADALAILRVAAQLADSL